jgi:site-specific DNA recombinase
MSQKNNSPFPPSSQIVAYLRDSGGDDQDLSVPQQESALRTWCASTGLTLSRTFADVAAPGSSTVGRAQFLAMIQYFRNGAPEAGLLIYKFSRFARDIDDAMFYKADLRRSGYIIHSLMDDIPQGVDGRFFEAARDWMNEKFLQDLSEDVKRGLSHLVTVYGAVPGTPPAGFMRQPITIGTRRDGTPHIVNKWVPNPATWEACRQAWHMRAHRASLPQILAATHIYPSINSLTTFFQNRLYLGELRYANLVIPNYCEPLIDQATWDTVQALTASRRIAQPGPNHPRRVDSTYLLSGLVYCALCGSAMSGNTVKFKGKPAYEYYQCSAARRRHDCAAAQIPRQDLEDLVMANLAGEILRSATIAAHQAELDRIADSEAGLIAAERTETNRRLAHARRRMANVTETIAELGKSPALIDKLRTLEAEQSGLLIHLADLTNSRRSPTLSPDQLTNITTKLQTLATGPEHRTELHQVLRAIIARVTVERKDRSLCGLITYYHPPEVLNSSEDLCLWEPPPVGAPSHRHKFITSLHSKTIS